MFLTLIHLWMVGIHNIFLVSNLLLTRNHVQRIYQDPLQTYLGFHSDCRVLGEFFRIATVRYSVSDLCGRGQRNTLSPFLVWDRNGGAHRLARDSGQENREIGLGLRACIWPRAWADRGRGW